MLKYAMSKETYPRETQRAYESMFRDPNPSKHKTEQKLSYLSRIAPTYKDRQPVSKKELDVYKRQVHLAVGMVSGKERKLYKKLLEMALETINGDFDDSNVSYGTEELSSDDPMDLSELLSFEDADEDDSKSDKSASEGKSLSDARQRSKRRRIPDFEEFLRMRKHTEAGSEEESSKESPKKAGAVLPMFARKKDADCLLYTSRCV